MPASPCRQTHVYLCGLSPVSSTFLSSSRVHAVHAHHSLSSLRLGCPQSLFQPLPKQQLPIPGLEPFPILLLTGSCSSWAAPPFQGLLTSFLMIIREEPTCGQQMQQTMASASFHFSSCSLCLSWALLGCGPHSSWEKVLCGSTVQDHLEVKALQRQIFKNNAVHFRCWKQV